jgi:hypothetical protein
VFLTVSLLEYCEAEVGFQNNPYKDSGLHYFAWRYALLRYGTNGLLKALAMAVVSFTIRHYQSVKQFRIPLWHLHHFLLASPPPLRVCR